VLGLPKWNQGTFGCSRKLPLRYFFFFSSDLIRGAATSRFLLHRFAPIRGKPARASALRTPPSYIFGFVRRPRRLWPRPGPTRFSPTKAVPIYRGGHKVLARVFCCPPTSFLASPCPTCLSNPWRARSRTLLTPFPLLRHRRLKLLFSLPKKDVF